MNAGTRVEITGNLIVHHPVKPKPKPQEATK